MHRALLDSKHSSRILIENQTSHVAVTDASICQTHNYMQRDDNDNASACSDDETHHHHRRHHTTEHSHNAMANTNNLETKSINIQAAVIHVIGDFIQSIGVFISALIIKYYVSHVILTPFFAIQIYIYLFYLLLLSFYSYYIHTCSPKQKLPIQYAHSYFQLLSYA